MSSGHCSDLRLHVLVDGLAQKVSPYLGPIEAGLWDWCAVLEIPARGVHTVSLQPEGRIGGCNRGFLGSWGGVAAIYEVKS